MDDCSHPTHMEIVRPWSLRMRLPSDVSGGGGRRCCGRRPPEPPDRALPQDGSTCHSDIARMGYGVPRRRPPRRLTLSATSGNRLVTRGAAGDAVTPPPREPHPVPGQRPHLAYLLESLSQPARSRKLFPLQPSPRRRPVQGAVSIGRPLEVGVVSRDGYQLPPLVAELVEVSLNAAQPIEVDGSVLPTAGCRGGCTRHRYPTAARLVGSTSRCAAR